MSTKIPYIHDAEQDIKKPTVGCTDLPKHFGGIDGNMSWATLCTFIPQALRKYMIKYIGQKLYDELCELITGEAKMTEAQQCAAQLLKDALAWYTMLIASPILNIRISDMGLMQNQSKEGAAQATNQWRYKDYLWHICQCADDHLDQLLELLQSSKDPVLAKWQQSEAAQCQASCFFNVTDDLDQYFNLGKSRRAYLQLIKHVRRADDQLERILCPTLFSNICNPMDGDKAEIKILRKLAKDYTAAKGMCIGVPKMAIVFDGDGFKVVSSSDNMDFRQNLNNQFTANAVAEMRQECCDRAEELYTDIQTYLIKHVECWPEWADESGYADEHCEDDNDMVIGSACGAVYVC